MAYKVHHLNTATLCPGNQRLINGKGSLLKKGKMVCHCLLVETHDGLVLIDTGFGLDDVTHIDTIADRVSLMSLGAIADPSECAATQIKKLGYKTTDVRHIILTHLDVDHAGGIKDFPHAQIHVHQNEFVAGMRPITLQEKLRYGGNKNWAHQPNWKTHQAVGEKWHGFDCVKVLSDELYDILLVPLHGHSRGHCGVAVSTTEGWVLHCGDAYFSQQEIKPINPSCPPMLAAVQLMDDTSRADRLLNQHRLHELHHDKGDRIRLICSHDHEEFDECCHYTSYLGRARTPI